MAKKKQSGPKSRSGQSGQGSRPSPAKGRESSADSGRQEQTKKKKPKGPSRGSGALSVGLGIFGMIWTFTMYMQKGPGGESLFGVFFVFLCLAHATYNFRAVNRQEAIDRGEIPDPKKKAEEEEARRAAAENAAGKRKYPVYRVKKKPLHILKRSAMTR